MHKWKLFKKSAALVLSSAVIASGVPVTAMASEAEVFSDVSGETPVSYTHLRAHET